MNKEGLRDGQQDLRIGNMGRVTGELELLSGQKLRLEVIQGVADYLLPRRPDLAEEVALEAALKIYLYPKPIDNLKAFVSRVVRNEVNDILYREHRQQDLQARLQEQSLSSFAEECRRTSEILHRAAVCSGVLDKITDRISDQQRSILLLVYQGHYIAEIARNLGIARQEVYEELAAIRKIIEDLEPPDPPAAPNGGGGERAGGDSAASRPPVRAGPGLLVSGGDGRRVAARQEQTQESEEVPRDGNRERRQRDRVRVHRERLGGAGIRAHAGKRAQGVPAFVTCKQGSGKPDSAKSLSGSLGEPGRGATLTSRNTGLTVDTRTVAPGMPGNVGEVHPRRKLLGALHGESGRTATLAGRDTDLLIGTRETAPGGEAERIGDPPHGGHGMGRAIPAREVRGAPESSTEEAVVSNLKRLLLQLPAFREAGLAAAEEPEVDNLEEVVARVVRGCNEEPHQ
jgi:DNA-directed RNA polymerase specialized sigma24 family protein